MSLCVANLCLFNSLKRGKRHFYFHKGQNNLFFLLFKCLLSHAKWILWRKHAVSSHIYAYTKESNYWNLATSTWPRNFYVSVYSLRVIIDWANLYTLNSFKPLNLCFCLWPVQGNVAGCPREPWHDLHCRIDGPAAYDVLANFQERWLKAAKPHGIKKLKMSYDDALLRIERIPDILGMYDAPCLGENDPEAWHVQVNRYQAIGAEVLSCWVKSILFIIGIFSEMQVFRSIDSNSVKDFPKDSRDAIQKVREFSVINSLFRVCLLRVVFLEA